jgi:hypothetical protein
MSRWFSSCIAVLAMASISSGAFAKAHFRGPMDGAQEVPPNGSPATGLSQILIDTNTNTLFYHISYTGLLTAETAAHIHGYAGPGVPAGVVHALPATNPKIGAWNYPAANEQQILNGLTYSNIHTVGFPGGEIRGQNIVEPATDIVALLNGAQEVPPNGSPGLGVGAFVIDTAANTLSYDIRFGLLGSAEIAAHFHQAPPGVPGGVVGALPLGSPKIGVWNYPDAQEANILGGLVYVNIHTSGFPDGEIRGQFETPSPATGVNVTFPGTGELSLFAAPNPLPHDDLALFYKAPEGERIAVDSVDVTGRVVRTLEETQSTRNGVFAWDTRDDSGVKVAGGVYFARLRTGSDQTTARFVVLR